MISFRLMNWINLFLLLLLINLQPRPSADRSVRRKYNQIFIIVEKSPARSSACYITWHGRYIRHYSRDATGASHVTRLSSALLSRCPVRPWTKNYQIITVQYWCRWMNDGPVRFEFDVSFTPPSKSILFYGRRVINDKPAWYTHGIEILVQK